MNRVKEHNSTPHNAGPGGLEPEPRLARHDRWVTLPTWLCFSPQPHDAAAAENPCLERRIPWKTSCTHARSHTRTCACSHPHTYTHAQPHAHAHTHDNTHACRWAAGEGRHARQFKPGGSEGRMAGCLGFGNSRRACTMRKFTHSQESFDSWEKIASWCPSPAHKTQVAAPPALPFLSPRHAHIAALEATF